MPEQKATGSGSKRQSLRVRASLSGRYMLADGRESMCKVIDVSARGNAANTTEPVAEPSAKQPTVPQPRPASRRPFIVGLYVVCVWLLTASIWTNATDLAGDYAAAAQAELGQAPLVLLAMLLRG